MPSIFAKFEGKNAPEGESQEQGHDKWVVLKSCAFTVARSMPEGARAAQRTRGETQLADIDCAMDQNKASLKIMQNCASGVPYGKVTIHFTRAGDDASTGQQTYLEYIMSDAMVVEYATSGSGEDVPEDTFKLNYTKIEMKYFISDRTGKLTEDSTFKWDKELSKMA
jgi:type VI secretion system secreted protein Hcp